MMVVAFAFVAVSSASAAYMHTVTLKQGSSGSQVMELQKTLGVGADGAFGPMTKAAVMSFQSANGLTADGVVGPMTGAKLAGAPASGGALCPNGNLLSNNCQSGGSTGSNGSLQGGAGSITVTAESTYTSEEVGEDEEDAGVLAFSVEADDESDVEVTSVKVELKQTVGTNSEDLTDYVDSVSIWMGDEEVGRVDAEDFTENSDIYTKTVSLDGAVVEAGDEVEFSVAVSALSNLDSGDIDDDSFGVDVLNVRFEDGEGVVTTEDTDGDTLDRTFDFASFASATDVELKVALNDDDEDTVNKAHVINVETGSSDTDDVEILSFTLEAEGDSDINVDEIPFTVTTTGETDESVIIRTVRLLDSSGDEIANDTVAAGGAGVFEDLDMDISAGDTEEFMITVDLQDLTGALDVGDTVKVEILGTDVDNIDATDESGEDLGAADLTGTALGEASEVRDIGFNVELVSTSAVISHVGDIAGSGAGDDDQATFTVTFDVTAFDGDIYIDGTSPSLTGAGAILDLNLVSTGTVALTSAIINSPSGATMTGTINADARFKVSEGETERFAVTVVSTVSADGLTHLEVDDIVYALTDVTGTTSYTFNLEDYKTADILMNAN